MPGLFFCDNMDTLRGNFVNNSKITIYSDRIVCYIREYLDELYLKLVIDACCFSGEICAVEKIYIN